MKIILIEHPRPRIPERCNDIANTPLSSCLLSGYTAATLLKEGHEVEIIEGHLEGLSYEEIKSRVRAFPPDIIGVHMIYHWGEDRALSNFLSGIKQEFEPRFMAAYGYYPTFALSDIFALFPSIDGVIVGEPEITFKSLADALSSGRCKLDIPGLLLAGGGGDFSKPDIAEDLDVLPFPVRKKTPAMLRLPEVNLLGSRGCYGKCTFCHTSSFAGAGWRGRSPENITEEINSIVSEFGTRDFYFTDPNFFGPGAKGQERALRLASMLGPLNIRFGIEARVNDIKDETICALARSGLRQILVGLESGRDDSLKRMKKMTTVRQGEEALKILRKYDIEPNIGFIMFEPGSALEDLKANLEFLKRNRLLENLPVTANVLNHHQIILKGTEAYKALSMEGRLETVTAYEGSAQFSVPEVGELASLMRRIANYLFLQMDDIWSGRTIPPPEAAGKYNEINRFFIGLFESALSRLMSGERLGPEKIELLATRAEKEISRLISAGRSGRFNLKITGDFSK